MRFPFRPRFVLLVLVLPALLLADAEGPDPAELIRQIGSLYERRGDTEKSIVAWSKKLNNYGVESEFRQRGAELAQRESELAFERTTLDARRKATEQQIAILERKVQQAVSSDALLEALDDHLDDARRLEKAGRATAEGVIQLRLQIAHRRDDVADRAGRAIVERLNADLVDMIIREAELEAQRRYLAQQRKELDTPLTAVRQLETDRAQLEWLAMEINRLNHELQNAQAAQRK